VCDHDCIITVTIQKRTLSTVQAVVRGELKVFRIRPSALLFPVTTTADNTVRSIQEPREQRCLRQSGPPEITSLSAIGSGSNNAAIFRRWRSK